MLMGLRDVAIHLRRRWGHCTEVVRPLGSSPCKRTHQSTPVYNPQFPDTRSCHDIYQQPGGVAQQLRNAR